MPSGQAIRIAIIGGGLGGTALARALVRNPKLDVHVYEADATFSERGASIGLANNAQRALAQVDPDDPGLLKRAGAVAQDSMRMVMVSSCLTPCRSSEDQTRGQESQEKNVHASTYRAWDPKPAPSYPTCTPHPKEQRGSLESACIAGPYSESWLPGFPRSGFTRARG